jgi:O-antigen/teichoic acid export membrane protein
MLASLVTTPIIVKILGSEGYGLLQLIILIPNYFAFADLGMGLASTRFAAEAYGRGDSEAEAKVIRTAALIALISSSIAAIPIAIFAPAIIAEFKIGPELVEPARLGLRLTSGTFICGVLMAIVNSPQLARIRMDLNALIGGGIKVTASTGAAIVLYLGYGIVGVAAWFLIVNILGVAAHLMVSRRLLRNFWELSIDKNAIRPLLRFGAGLTASAVAAVFLLNLEKLLLGWLISVESLAYYTIAFTLASMAMMFSMAMVQSLVPAFSQLLSPEKREQFTMLFVRGMKLSIVGLLPTLMVLFVAAKPFFTIWAGPDYGRESPLPFYILLGGLLFNIVAYVPYGCLVAAGKTDQIGKLHWAEVFPYAAIAVVLITYLGIAGAALAWSIRVLADAFIIVSMALKVVGPGVPIRRIILTAAAGVAVLSPPILIALLYDNYSPILLAAVPACLAAYTLIIWKYMVRPDERRWMMSYAKMRLDKLRPAR